MMQAAAHDDGNPLLTWHQICAFPRCPPLLVRLLLAQKDDHDNNNDDDSVSLSSNKSSTSGTLLQRNKIGQVPLHLAASSPAINLQHGVPPLVQTVAPSVLEFVLSAAPTAAHVADTKGCYPLHEAPVRNPALSNATILILTQASPMVALTTVDPQTGLCPVQQVAATRRSSMMPDDNLGVRIQ